MTLEEIKNEMDFYEETVMKQPIGKDLKGHLIQGFGVEPTTSEQYELYVLGQDLTHAIPIIKKPLEQWLTENGY